VRLGHCHIVRDIIDRGTCVLTTCPGLHLTAGRPGFEPVTVWHYINLIIVIIVIMDGIQVSSRPSARLLVWAVHAGCSSRWTTASPFSQPQLAHHPKVPAEHVWSSCLCRGCASNLELTVGWTAKPRSPQCHLPTQLEDVSVSTILGALSALEALCDYALYKSTFTLH